MQIVNSNFGVSGTLQKTRFQALPHCPASAISYWCNALITVNVCVGDGVLIFSFSLCLR